MKDADQILHRVFDVPYSFDLTFWLFLGRDRPLWVEKIRIREKAYVELSVAQ